MFKHYYLFLLLSILLANKKAHCQTVIIDTARFSGKMILTMNPLALFGNGMEINFEKSNIKRHSWRFTAGYYLATKPYYYEFYDGFNGVKMELQKRFYLRKFNESRKGTYIAPFLQYKHINLYKNISYLLYTGTPPVEQSVTERDNTFASAASFGFVFGLQELSLRSRFVIDMFIGSGILIPLNDYVRSVPHLIVINPYEQGIYFKIGLALGVALN
ncbi:MAG: hypothetical protein MUE81_04230 [Thermoflexibacter sp.]|jgi:hypothetical protein|nr:hypothetical protein [Thermoflexibacter sp.]